MSEPTHWQVGLSSDEERPIAISLQHSTALMALSHAKAMRDALILLIARVEESEQIGGQHD